MLNEELEKEKRNRTLMTLALETDEKNLEESAGPIRLASGHTLMDMPRDGKAWRDALLSCVESAMSSYEVGEFGCALQEWVDVCMITLS